MKKVLIVLALVEATGAIDVPTGNTIHFTDGAITLPARGVLVLEF